MVIVMAFGVGAIGWGVFVQFKVRRTLAEFGSGTTLSSGWSILTVAFFSYMAWLLISVVRDAIREWPTAPHSEITSQTVCTGFREVFTEQPPETHPAYRYGMLAIILALLGWNIEFLVSLSPRYIGDRFGNLVVPLMLLFNHLAFSFRWSATVSFAMRVLAIGWLVMGGAYILLL